MFQGLERRSTEARLVIFGFYSPVAWWLKVMQILAGAFPSAAFKPGIISVLAMQVTRSHLELPTSALGVFNGEFSDTTFELHICVLSFLSV